MIRLAVLLATLAAALPARAEQLVTALSHDRVAISSNFTGTQIVVFGTIERDAQTIARSGRYEVVVTVSGPPVNVITRRKDRTFGIWVNRDSEVMAGVPSFLAIHSTRQLQSIMSDPLRARLGLGLDMLPINAETSTTAPVRTDFEASFLRLMEQNGRYRYVPGGVEFLSSQLFRAPINLPADISVGSYTATVYLFKDGAALSTTREILDIRKVGFEQMMSRHARVNGLWYGLATVLIACFTGWLAGVVFRRD